MSSSAELKRCPKCGGPIPAEAPQGLCSSCLLQQICVPTEAGSCWSRWTSRPGRVTLGRQCRPSVGWWMRCRGWAGLERGRPESAAEGRAEERRAALGVAFENDDATGVDRGAAAHHGHPRAPGVAAATPRPKPARRPRWPRPAQNMALSLTL